jgi:predicted nucleic acid-binding protein
MYQVVIDTNVLVSGLRSSLGASFRLLKLLGDSRWRPNLTASLALEYEAVLKREGQPFEMTNDDIDDLLDAFCAQAAPIRHVFIFNGAPPPLTRMTNW